jgi:hypothetical protein
MRPIRLRIEGPAAATRFAAVKDALALLPGVLGVSPEPDPREIRVEAADEIDPDKLIAALREAGVAATLAG